MSTKGPLGSNRRKEHQSRLRKSARIVSNYLDNSKKHDFHRYFESIECNLTKLRK